MKSMSALSVDCPSLSATLELPYSPAQPPARQLGLANLTLWLNSEITNQIQARGTAQGPKTRVLTRLVAKAVLAKMDMSETQQELIWLIRAEVESAFGAIEHESLSMSSDPYHTHGGELPVVPTEMHHPMTRTPLPALHPVLRAFGWFEAVHRGVHVFFSRLIAGFVPNSPSA